MDKFDKYLRKKASEEQREIPEAAKKRIEHVLNTLPEKEKKTANPFTLRRISLAAATAAVLFVGILPNMSAAYAEALEQVPVIGNIVRVVTVRNYFYSDDKHEMEIEVPKVDGENSEAVDFINKDIGELTDTLVQRFYDDLEDIGDDGHSAVYVDHETVTNTDDWFTLKLIVHEAVGSSNTYFRYYHINRLTGEIIRLGDLAADERFYDTMTREIKRQMKAQMENDENAVYWLDDSTIGDCVYLTAEHNFYFNKNGELVIPFDKYEVAPGSMGCPEFAIPVSVTDDIIKEEFKNIDLT